MLEKDEQLQNTRILLLGQVGSKAYGTATPQSDDDYMAVCIAPNQHYFGLDRWHNDGTLERKRSMGHEIDMVAFELKKFLRLCVAFNPNVIPLLYLRKSDYLEITPGGQSILDNRDLFVSLKAFDTFVGYAKSQRNKVVNGETGKLGQKRKELVKEFGFDTKFAYHTIRLMRMLVEFLETGTMSVYREHDAMELLLIRAGGWTLQQFLDEVDSLFAKAEDLKTRSGLPPAPNMKAVTGLCMAIIFAHNYTEIPVEEIHAIQ